MIHKKKIWPEKFQDIISGKRKFDIRLSDFDCKENDILLLEEFNPKTKEYTGRTLKKKITSIAKTKEIPYWSREEIAKYGLQILSLE